MFFVLLSFLSLKLFAQAESLSRDPSEALLTQNSSDLECVFELDLKQAEQAFLRLNSEFREHFLALARLRVSIAQSREAAQSRSEFFLMQLKQFREVFLKNQSIQEFDLFFGFAQHLVRREKNDSEIIELKKEILELNQSLELLPFEGHKTLKTFYDKFPNRFSEHRKKGYFKTDFGLNLLDEGFGLAYSIQLKELIRKIVNAKDLSDERAFDLLKTIRPKFKFGDAQSILEFGEMLKGSSLEAWAEEAMPRLFIDLNRAPTRLGQKISEILWPKNRPKNLEENIKLKEFIIRAIKIPEADIFWTTQSILRAFRGILLGSVESWLSKPASDHDVIRHDVIRAKARYLGLILNQLDYENWLALVPQSELEEVKKAIDEFTILRLIREGVLKKLQGWRRWFTGFMNSIPTLEDLTLLELVTFEFIEAPISPQGITYWMGSPLEEWGRGKNEKQVEVTLKEPFQFGSTKVIVWLYTHITGRPILYSKHYDEAMLYILQNDLKGVDFYSAQKFAKTLTSFLKKIDPNHPCRYELSTEAKWEFMVRAGTKAPFFFGKDKEDLLFLNQLSSMQFKFSNGFGVFAAHSDVPEWQQDHYVNFLPGGVDPVVVDSEEGRRVLRGGNSTHEPFQRLAYRRDEWPIEKAGVGIRLVRICQ